MKLGKYLDSEFRWPLKNSLLYSMGSSIDSSIGRFLDISLRPSLESSLHGSLWWSIRLSLGKHLGSLKWT